MKTTSGKRRRRRRSMRSAGWLVYLRAGLIVGALLAIGLFSIGLATGKSRTDRALRRAKVALTSGRPDLALEFAVGVLEERRADSVALQIKAKAEMQLGDLDHARSTIDVLLESDPDRIRVRRLAIEWTFRRVDRLLAHPGLVQGEFEEVIRLGWEQVEWLAGQPAAAADAHYLRARYAIAEIRRLRLNSKDVESQLGEVEEHLAAALATDPRHVESATMYVRLLSDRNGWAALWELAEAVSRRRPLRLSLVESFVAAISRIPDEIVPATRRTEVGWQLLSAVSRTQQPKAAWKIAGARLHLVSRNYSGAQALTAEVVKTNPQSSEAGYLLALSFFHQRQYQQAVDALSRFGAESSSSASVLTLLGLNLGQLGHRSRAADALRRALEINPSAPQAVEALLALAARRHATSGISDSEFDLGDWASPLESNDARVIGYKIQRQRANGNRQVVAEILSDLESLPNVGNEHLRVLVNGYLYLGESERAEHAARALVERLPDASDAQFLLAEVLIAGSVPRNAGRIADLLTDLGRRYPESARVTELRGRLFLKEQRFDRAIAALEDVVSVEPHNHSARLLLARSLAAMSLLDASLDQVVHVLEADPQNNEAYAMLIGVCRAAGEPQKADEHLARMDLSRIDERVHPGLLAGLKLRARELDKAAAICERALHAGHSDPLLRLVLAQISIERGDRDEAESHLLALVRSQPGNALGYTLLSRLYFEHADVEHGLEALGQLESHNQPLARFARAMLLRMAGDCAQAIDLLQPVYESLIVERSPMALSVADEIVAAHLHCNGPFARLKARTVYESLVAADVSAMQAGLRQIDLCNLPDDFSYARGKLDALAVRLKGTRASHTGLRRGVLQRFRGLGLHDRAAEVIDVWIASDAGDPTLLRWKAELLLETGRYHAATTTLRRGVELFPDSLVMWERLAQGYLASFDFPTAEATFNRIYEFDAAAQKVALAGLSKLYVNLGLNRRAAELLGQLHDLRSPLDPHILLTFGEVLAIAGQNAAAGKALNQVPRYADQYAPAQMLLVRIEHREQMLDQARQRLEDLVKNPQTSDAAIGQLLFGDASGQYELIVWAERMRSVEQLPHELRLAWLHMKVTLAADRSDWDSALEALDSLAELDTQNELPTVAALRIALLVHFNRIDEARQLFETASELDSDSLAPLLELVVAAPGQTGVSGDPGSTMWSAFLQAVARGDLACARQAVKDLPRGYGIRNWRPVSADAKVSAFGPAMSAIYRSDLSAFLDQLETVSPEMVDACRRLAVATIARACGIPQLCREICEELIDEQPQFTPAWGLNVSAMSDVGALQDHENVDAADVQVKRATPDSSVSLLLSARRKAMRVDYAGAATDLQELLLRDTNSPYARYLLSQMFVGDRRIDSAITVLEQLVADPNPWQSIAANDLAFLLAEQYPNRLAEARRLAQDNLQASPANPPLLDTLGWIEHLSGNDDGALKYLILSAAGMNSQPEVHFHLGTVYMSLGQERWARYHLDQAAHADGDQPEVSKARALLESINGPSVAVSASAR